MEAPVFETTPFQLGAAAALGLSVLVSFFLGYRVLVMADTPQNVVLLLGYSLGLYAILGFIGKLVSREDSWHWILAILLPSLLIFTLLSFWVSGRLPVFGEVLLIGGVAIYLGAQIGKRVRPKEL